MRSSPPRLPQHNCNPGSIKQYASRPISPLAKLPLQHGPSTLHKHLKSTEMAAKNCPTLNSMATAGLCVAPGKVNAQSGQHCGVRKVRDSRHSGSRPPQAGKKTQESHIHINSNVALPAIWLQGNGQEPFYVPALETVGHPGTSETAGDAPACCVKRRTRGRFRRYRSSWHGLVAAGQNMAEMFGVDEAWLQNDLLPYADCMYG